METLRVTQNSSAERLWEAALGRLQLQVTRPSFDTWLRDTRGLSLAGHHMVVSVPTTFTAEWLDKRMYSLIEKAVTVVARHPVEVSFQVPQPPSAAPYSSEPPLANGNSQSNGAAPAVRAAPAPFLHPRYTFASFVAGSSNELALAASRAVADRPGHAYNPLFLYAGVGLGKTHLLHAISHHALQMGRTFRYVTCEQFTNDFITSIRDRRTSEFRNSYRAVDMLLIDDIQFIDGKEQTQEGFFHTFNALHNSGRQIVLTCDRSPRALPLLEERLCSRFEWGLIADIQPPGLETRLAILKSKAQQCQVNVPREVLGLIADRAQSNVRELEGLLNRTLALADLTGSPITEELASRALGPTPGPARPLDDMARRVIAAAANYFGVSPQALTSAKRDARTVAARQAAMHLLREDLHLTLQQIGAALGGRSHATALATLRKAAAAVRTGAPLAEALTDIRSHLNPTNE